MSPNTPVVMLFISALIALAFLIYSLLNLKRLNITCTHPRVIVELFLFLGFTIAGVLLWLKG